MRDYYLILGLDPSLRDSYSDPQIETAYSAKKSFWGNLPADLSEYEDTDQELKEIEQAYDCLKTTHLRSAYNNFMN